MHDLATIKKINISNKTAKNRLEELIFTLQNNKVNLPDGWVVDELKSILKELD